MKELTENFKFLVTETENQIRQTSNLLYEFNESLIEKIASKDDYIDNLKTIVENRCFSRIHGENLDEKETDIVRSIHIICVNLERIADYCVNVARQMYYLTEPSFIHRYNYQEMFSAIQNATSKIVSVYRKGELGGALEICRAEYDLDKMYKKHFDRIMAELQTGFETGNLITVLFIFRYLERIGDSLLNIGEGLVFAIIGDRIKIRQIEALEQTLSESGFNGKLTDIEFSSIWGSRSGCRIGKVETPKNEEQNAQGIFKEGIIKKIKLEKENIKKWDEIHPGLAPRVFGYYEKGGKASLLVEYLPGCTFDEVALTASDEILENAVFILEHMLIDIWNRTLSENSADGDYMEQLKSRLPSVLNVHPDMFRKKREIDLLTVSSTEQLIDRCQKFESVLNSPFSVFIHGDFNANNIVYYHEQQTLHYIDLYRSKNADYVQDASVFLVSFYRLPVFEADIRKRLNWLIGHFYDIFSLFARKNNDETFDLRLALGIARSFYTSVRFEMNMEFARDMFLRSHYLMEKVVDHQNRPPESFVFPAKVLFY